MIDDQRYIPHQTFVTIEGHDFPYVWLRDHCLCPKCYDPVSRQKTSDLRDFILDPQPLSIERREDTLVIRWNEQPSHQSIFPLSWLLAQTHNSAEHSTSTGQPILWDRTWFEARPVEWPNYCADHQTIRQDLSDRLSSFGFSVLRNIPTVETLEALLLSIGPIYEFAKFGNFSTVKPVPSSSDLSSDLSMSSKGPALSPHTDFTYLHSPPLVQALYCVENEAPGGDSIVVDGFRLASDLRKNHPEHFFTLASTPVTFNQYIARWQYLFSQSSPIFQLNEKKEVVKICFSHKNIEINFNHKETDLFYRAYSTFLNYLNNPNYRYYYRLQKGDCLFVNNFRTLHGRKGFNAHLGNRHLEIAFVEWDYFQGLKNFDASDH